MTVFNETVQFGCVMVGYVPPLSSIVWFKDNLAIGNVNVSFNDQFCFSFQLLNASTTSGNCQMALKVVVYMTLNSFTSSDVGTYVCRVFGTSLSGSIELSDIEPSAG